MYTFKKWMTEEKQVGTLYHYTSLAGLNGILSEGKLGFGKSSTVCFTRDKNFHKHPRSAIETQCRLVVDGTRMSRKIRIRPYNYYKDEYHSELMAYESEERVKGQIDNFLQYVTEINLCSSVLERTFYMSDGVLLTRDYSGQKVKSKKEALIYFENKTDLPVTII
jgi:hypothetical protein